MKNPELFKNAKIVCNHLVNQFLKFVSDFEDKKIFEKEFIFLIQYSMFNIATNKNTKKISFLEMLYIANIGDINDENFKHRLDNELRDDKRKKWSFLLFFDRSVHENTIVLFKQKMFNYMSPIKLKIINFIKKRIKKNDIFVEMLFNLYQLFFKIGDRLEQKNSKEILINEIKDSFGIDIKNLTKIK